MQSLLSILALLLMALGLLFAIIEFRTRFENVFAFFGISLICLSLLSVIDIFLVRADYSSSMALWPTRIYVALSSTFFTICLFYVLLFTRHTAPRLLLGWCITGAVSICLALSNMFIVYRDGMVRSTPLYDYFFTFYTLIAIILSLYFSYRPLQKGHGGNRRVYLIHFIGISFLAIGGFIDQGILIFRMHAIEKFIPSSLVLGTFVYGLTASAIFLLRFKETLMERQQTFEKLKSAYRSLEGGKALRLIGESTAAINHEIRNYMTSVTVLSRLVQSDPNLSEKGSEKLTRIQSISTEAMTFCQSVLDMGRIREQLNLRRIDIAAGLKTCLQKTFGNYDHWLTLEGFDTPVPVHADLPRLGQVFVNILKNSREATCPGRPLQVSLRIQHCLGRCMLIVEDNGIGCTAQQQAKLGTAFYTTKENCSGAGLGLSVCRAILEAHGGYLGIYSKNIHTGNQGMQVIVTLYPADRPEQIRRPEVVFIKQDLENWLDQVVMPLQRMGIIALIEATRDGIAPRTLQDPAAVVLAAPHVLDTLMVEAPAARLFTLQVSNGFLLCCETGQSLPAAQLSEEFVVQRLAAAVLSVCP